MEMVLCERNHYYDREKYSSCPYCASAKNEGDGFVFDFQDDSMAVDIHPKMLNFDADDEKTVAKRPEGFYRYSNDDGKTVSYEETDDDGKTVAYSGDDLDLDAESLGAPLVGWLVCKDGPEKGRDYRIFLGKNFIGRSFECDVAIETDRYISRKNHASIIYDPKHNEYLLLPGVGTVTYLNGEMITGASVITEYDEIKLGKTTLVFVAYCKGEFKW